MSRSVAGWQWQQEDQDGEREHSALYRTPETAMAGYERWLQQSYPGAVVRWEAIPGQDGPRRAEIELPAALRAELREEWELDVGVWPLCWAE